MRNRSWIVAAVATAGVVLGAALYAHELESGHADVDVAATRVSKVSKVSKVSAPGRCVGTRPVGSLPIRDDNSPMYRLAGHIDALAVGAYAAVYTGLSVDDRTQTLDVWRIPSARFDAAVCGAALKGVTVRLHDSDVSRKSLDKLSDRIGDDMKRWDGTFRMREAGVNERGFVRVGVDDPDKAEPIIKKAYGAKNAPYIKVEYVDQASALSAPAG
ncbi:hypothetical protein ACGFY7_34045 [Streptomyces prunicolor]|uniref:hypothetical protein n=1 Tax=Streptomyces prunicolor TaxID=67348 RepID=UPI0037187523